MSEIKQYIRDIPDFPEEGILFKDITPLLKDFANFKRAIKKLVVHYREVDFDYIAAIESRGFLIGTPMALEMEKGFIPIRKPGKLPAEVVRVSYELEYGKNTLEMHCDAISPGNRVLIVDDLLATGGTTSAAIQLIEKLDGEVVGTGFLLELEELRGREKLKGYEVFSLLKD
ncbi:MAG: adenine phosphoribosyltransferase [Halanaerobiales bacterium]